ncbi:MAG: hypothetical protein ACREC5_01890, partial [Thermoplasmata archaeon]
MAGPAEAATGPVARVRARIAAAHGPDAAALLPRGYIRLGRVLILRLPESLRPYHPSIGAAYAEELRVASVLVRA